MKSIGGRFSFFFLQIAIRLPHHRVSFNSIGLMWLRNICQRVRHFVFFFRRSLVASTSSLHNSNLSTFSRFPPPIYEFMCKLSRRRSDIVGLRILSIQLENAGFFEWNAIIRRWRKENWFRNTRKYQLIFRSIRVSIWMYRIARSTQIHRRVFRSNCKCIIIIIVVVRSASVARRAIHASGHYSSQSHWSLAFSIVIHIVNDLHRFSTKMPPKNLIKCRRFARATRQWQNITFSAYTLFYTLCGARTTTTFPRSRSGEMETRYSCLPARTQSHVFSYIVDRRKVINKCIRTPSFRIAVLLFFFFFFSSLSTT